VDDPSSYLAEVELALIGNSIIAGYELVRTWFNSDDGYIRLRAALTNGDFLEAAEYFVLRSGEPIPVDYRYQWMDGSRQRLRRRWDNTPHHPELTGFPNHVHMEGEERVVPGQPTGLLDLLRILESEISHA